MKSSSTWKLVLLTLHQPHDVNTKEIKRIVFPVHICWFTINYHWSWRKKFLQGKIKSRIAIFCSALPDWSVYGSKYSFSPAFHHKFLPGMVGTWVDTWPPLPFLPRTRFISAPCLTLSKTYHAVKTHAHSLCSAGSFGLILEALCTYDMCQKPMSEKIQWLFILLALILTEKWGILWAISEKIVTICNV